MSPPGAARQLRHKFCPPIPKSPHSLPEYKLFQPFTTSKAGPAPSFQQALWPLFSCPHSPAAAQLEILQLQALSCSVCVNLPVLPIARWPRIASPCLHTDSCHPIPLPSHGTKPVPSACGHCSPTSGPSYSGHSSASFNTAPTQQAYQPPATLQVCMASAQSSHLYQLFLALLQAVPTASPGHAVSSALWPSHSGTHSSTSLPALLLCRCLAWPQTLMTSPQWASVDRELEKVTWSQPGGEQGLPYVRPTHSDTVCRV